MTRATAGSMTSVSPVARENLAAIGVPVLLAAGAAVAVVGWAGGDLAWSAAGGAVLLAALVLLTASDPAWGLYAVALAIPLPAIYSHGDTRIAAVAPVAAAVVAGWILHVAGLSRSAVYEVVPRRGIAAFAFAVLLATATSAHPLAGVRESVNLGVLLLLLLAVVDHARRHPDIVPRVARVIVTIATVVAVLAILEMVSIIPGDFPRPGTPFNRASLGFGQPNALGLFLAVVFPLAVWRVESARSRLGKWLALLATAVIGSGLLATFSRGSWLSVGLGAGIGFFIGDARRTLKIWLIGLVGAAVFDLVSGGLLRDTFQRTIGDWVVEQRLSLTLAGILMFLAHPIVGVGPGAYALELDRFGARIPQLWDYRPTPHDAWVQMAAETGIVGLVAYVVFIVACGRVIIANARHAMTARVATRGALHRAFAWSFAAFCLEGFFVWPFSHGAGEAVIVTIALGLVGTAAP